MTRHHSTLRLFVSMAYLVGLFLACPLSGHAAGPVLITQSNISSFVLLGGPLKLACNSWTHTLGTLSRKTLSPGVRFKPFQVKRSLSLRRKKLKELNSKRHLSRSLSGQKKKLRRELRSIRYGALVCGAGAGEPQGHCGQISQYGITWTFDKEHLCGQFINGDWWVSPGAAGSAVTVTDVLPRPIHEKKMTEVSCSRNSDCNEYVPSCGPDNKCSYDRRNNESFYNSYADLSFYPATYTTEKTCTSGTVAADCTDNKHFYDGKCVAKKCEYTLMRNGWSVNPVGGDSSYDSRDGNYEDIGNRELPIIAPSSSSLVSTQSNPDKTVCHRPGAGPDGWYNYLGDCGESFYLKSAAVLTVLAAPPLQGSFRPPYAGPNKTIRHFAEELNQPGKGFSALARLQIPTSSKKPDLEHLTRRLQRPWINHSIGWSQQFSAPCDNMVTYGREVASLMGDAALLLNTAMPNEEKRQLLINYLQVGLDHFGLVQNGMYWPPDGGHASGRKLPIMFAGFVFGDDSMKGVGKAGDNSGRKQCGDRICFGEDAQTFYVEEANIGKYFTLPYSSVQVIYGDDATTPEVEKYSRDQVGLPEWGIRHGELQNSLEPTLASDRVRWGAGYRQCCNAIAWGAYVLTAHIMEMREEWHHNALFDYQDRYMEVTKAGGPEFGWRPTGFAGEMWDAYRKNYGCFWALDNSADAYSKGHFNCAGALIRCPWQASGPGELIRNCPEYPNERACRYDPCNFRCKGSC